MRKHLIIMGRVQGVWYRDWFTQQAEGLGVTGWVRNRRDGSVEAMIDGGDSEIEALIGKAREGSPASRVDNIEISDASTNESFDGFARVATA